MRRIYNFTFVSPFLYTMEDYLGSYQGGSKDIKFALAQVCTAEVAILKQESKCSA